MKDERFGPHGEPRYTASRDALELACRELADVAGTCPYDQHHLECAHWESDCEERCRGDDVETLMAGCWRRYFEEKAGSR